MIWRLIIRATGDQTESDGSGRVLYENLENLDRLRIETEYPSNPPPFRVATRSFGVAHIPSKGNQLAVNKPDTTMLLRGEITPRSVQRQCNHGHALCCALRLGRPVGLQEERSGRTQSRRQNASLTREQLVGNLRWIAGHRVQRLAYGRHPLICDIRGPRSTQRVNQQLRIWFCAQRPGHCVSPSVVWTLIHIRPRAVVLL